MLQVVFEKHKIMNNIPVERLVKLRFQDNFEFCQFVKKYWDTYCPNPNYDAIGRRKGIAGAEPTRKVGGMVADKQNNELLVERDFYYSKLMQVEKYVQEKELEGKNEVEITQILKIIYEN